MGVYPPRDHGAFPQDGPMGHPIFDYNADDMTFLSFDNHFETKVLFLMQFGSQIINKYYDDTNNGRMPD